MAETENNGSVVNLKIETLEKNVEKLLRDVDELKLSVARLSERMTLFQVFQATLSSILASIAAIISRIP